jgi:predicted ATPase/DNA-binding XRE family transcriptional regulator
MSTPRTQTTFAVLLRRHRHAAGLTQEELAARAGLGVRTIRDLERGVSRAPHRETLALLADALPNSHEERATLVSAARAMHGATPHPPQSRGARPPGVLPIPPTPLIGREHEEAAVTHLLLRRDVRLLTLTGAPGIGKTRLAMQVAAGLCETFADGMVFVGLAAIHDPTLLLSALAQALGVRDAGSQSLDATLAAHLRDKGVLLVLDNCEQVVAAAPLLAHLLASCPELKILVTSRAALRIRGEQEFTVPPLALPDSRHLPGLDDLAQYAAVALFVHRAQAVKPTFALTPTLAAHVAAICERLDGLPLALELAAARIKLLSPQALMARLESSLALLTHGPADLPARQQTMRCAIAWSYDLLAEQEQRLFRRLSVFARGWWTLEAAEAVCGAKGERPGDVLDALQALVDESLVVQGEGADGEARYRLLELIREYALERLEASGEAETLRRRHAEYCLALAHEMEYPPRALT